MRKNVPNDQNIPAAIRTTTTARTVRTLSRSFTLIEILIAAAIFAVAVTVVLISLTSVFKSRSKGDALKNNQEAARQAVETMASGVEKGVGFEQGWGGVLYPFAIVALTPNDGSSFIGLNQDNVPGHRLRIELKNPDRSQSRKIFGLYNQDNTLVDSCNVGDGCYVGWTDGTAPPNRLTSENVEVTNLTFSGYYNRIDQLQKAPYVTIDLTLESQYQQGGKAEEQDVAEFKTTVVPNSTTNYFSTLPLELHLYTDTNHDGTYNDQGKFVETSIGTFGSPQHYTHASWTTTTNHWESIACMERMNGGPAQPNTTLCERRLPYYIIKSQYGRCDPGMGGTTGISCLNAARTFLKFQSTQIRLVRVNEAGQVIGAPLGYAHLYIDGSDRGYFIEASIDSTQDDQMIYNATWTGRPISNPDPWDWATKEPTNDWYENGPRYLAPDGCASNDPISAARCRLKLQKPEMKIVSPTGGIIGTVHIFANGTDGVHRDRGKYIESSVGLAGSGRILQSTWTTDQDEWYYAYESAYDWADPLLFAGQTLYSPPPWQGFEAKIVIQWRFE